MVQAASTMEAAPVVLTPASVEPVAAPVVTPATAMPVHTAPAGEHAPYPPQAADPIVIHKSVEQLRAERHTMLDLAGLALVETDAGKWRTAYEHSAQIVEPAHAPRSKRPAAVIDQGPLELVETRK